MHFDFDLKVKLYTIKKTNKQEFLLKIRVPTLNPNW